MADEDEALDIYAGLEEEEDSLYAGLGVAAPAVEAAPAASFEPVAPAEPVKPAEDPKASLAPPETASLAEPLTTRSNRAPPPPAVNVRQIPPEFQQMHMLYHQSAGAPAQAPPEPEQVSPYRVPPGYVRLDDAAVAAENPQRSAGVYLGDLPWWASDSDLFRALDAAGLATLARAVDVTFQEQKANGRSRGLAFVELCDDEAAARFVRHVNDHQLCGVRPSVHFAPSGQIGNPFRQVPKDPNERLRQGAAMPAAMVAAAAMGTLLRHNRMMAGSMFVPRPTAGRDVQFPTERVLAGSAAPVFRPAPDDLAKSACRLTGVYVLPPDESAYFAEPVATVDLLDAERHLIEREDDLFRNSMRGSQAGVAQWRRPSSASPISTPTSQTSRPDVRRESRPALSRSPTPERADGFERRRDWERRDFERDRRGRDLESERGAEREWERDRGRDRDRDRDRGRDRDRDRGGNRGRERNRDQRLDRNSDRDRANGRDWRQESTDRASERADEYSRDRNQARESRKRGRESDARRAPENKRQRDSNDGFPAYDRPARPAAGSIEARLGNPARDSSSREIRDSGSEQPKQPKGALYFPPAMTSEAPSRDWPMSRRVPKLSSLDDLARQRRRQKSRSPSASDNGSEGDHSGDDGASSRRRRRRRTGRRRPGHGRRSSRRR